MIFLDTGFLFALFCERDSHHQRVRAVLEPYRGRRLQDLVVTTKHVVSETITMIRKKSHADPGIRHDKAVKAGQRLFAEALGRIHQVTAEQDGVCVVRASGRRGRAPGSSCHWRVLDRVPQSCRFLFFSPALPFSR